MITLAFVVTGSVCFSLGWKANDWWKRQQAQGKGIDVFKPRFTTFGLTYFAMFAIFIGAVVWSDVRADDKVSDSEERQNDLNTVRVACIGRTFEDFLVGNQELRDANVRWREALAGSKRAESVLNQLRYIDKRSYDDPAITQAAEQYVAQTAKFLKADADYNKALVKYKLPDFEKRCGKLKARIADVLYRQIQEPDWRAQLTSSLE